jgi:hypothetical protein
VSLRRCARARVQVVSSAEVSLEAVRHARELLYEARRAARASLLRSERPARVLTHPRCAAPAPQRPSAGTPRAHRAPPGGSPGPAAAAAAAGAAAPPAAYGSASLHASAHAHAYRTPGAFVAQMVEFLIDDATQVCGRGAPGRHKRRRACVSHVRAHVASVPSSDALRLCR